MAERLYQAVIIDDEMWTREVIKGLGAHVTNQG